MNAEPLVCEHGVIVSWFMSGVSLDDPCPPAHFCRDCWPGVEVTELNEGESTYVPSRETLIDLICEWYEEAGDGHGYGAGGAFHVVLDDLNVGRELIEWCWENRREHGCRPDDDDLMAGIRNGLLSLSEDEQEAVIREAHLRMGDVGYAPGADE